MSGLLLVAGRKARNCPGLKRKEEQMSPLKPAFTRANTTYHGFSRFGLLLLAIAIDDDRQRRDKEREQKKWLAHIPRSAPAPVPRPF